MFQIMKAVTVLFSQVVNFNEICSSITPMEVVNILNSMYTKFDNLTEVHKVYKVRTRFLYVRLCAYGCTYDLRVHACMNISRFTHSYTL